LLAVSTPTLVFLAAKLGVIARTATAIAAPLIALTVLFAFAFHLRFALGAFAGKNAVAKIVAAIAILVGVTGLLGSVLVLLGMVPSFG
jgi:hypothetical protein